MQITIPIIFLIFLTILWEKQINYDYQIKYL